MEAAIIDREVGIPITKEQKESFADLLAQDEIELDALITDNKHMNAVFREDKKAIQDNIKKRSQIIAEGKEYKTIPTKIEMIMLRSASMKLLREIFRVLSEI